MSDTPRIDQAQKNADSIADLAEMVRPIEIELRRATMGRCQCSDCGKEVLNAWRDQDGHHCLTCTAKQRDEARDELERNGLGDLTKFS